MSVKKDTVLLKTFFGEKVKKKKILFCCGKSSGNFFFFFLEGKFLLFFYDVTFYVDSEYIIILFLGVVLSND